MSKRSNDNNNDNNKPKKQRIKTRDEQIDEDSKYLKNKHITLKQISDMLKKIKLHYKYINYSANILGKSVEFGQFTQEQRKTLAIYSKLVHFPWVTNNAIYVDTFRCLNNLVITTFVKKWKNKCIFSDCSCELDVSAMCIINLDMGRHFYITDEISHQISEHGFFGMNDSEYRCSPESIIDVLCLKPDVKYETVTKQISIWTFKDMEIVSDLKKSSNLTNIKNMAKNDVNENRKIFYNDKDAYVVIDTKNIDKIPQDIDGSEIVDKQLIEFFLTLAVTNSDVHYIIILSRQYVDILEDNELKHNWIS